MGEHPLATFRKSCSPPLRQKDLAKLLNVARETVARWETGRKIHAEMLPTVVAETGISAIDLRPDLAKLLSLSKTHNGSKGKR